METLIQWSNENTGFLMALLTAIYVFATIWIVVESRLSNRLNKKIQRDRNRPNIAIWIDAKHRTYNAYSSEIEYWIHMRNEGANTAHTINVSSKPALNPRRGLDADGNPILRVPAILQSPTSVLVPGQLVSEAIGPSKYMFEDHSDEELCFKLTITYSDIDGKKYTNEYDIDLAPQKSHFLDEDRQSKVTFELLDKVSEISKSLEGIHRVLNQPDRSHMFARWDNLELTPAQKELFEKLAEEDMKSKTPGHWWMLQEAIGSTTVFSLSESEQKFEVSAADVEALCQQGSLVGYYRNGMLLFRMAPHSNGSV